MTHRYIALLRGINVGGRVIKMEQLRKLFTELGFSNVRSYINSGNIFFDTDDSDRKKLSYAIEQNLHKALGYEVPVFLRTIDELESILSQDPFKNIVLSADKRFCVVFTSDPIDSNLTLPIHSSKNDMDLIAINPQEAFVVWHIINGRPPSGRFPNNTLPAVTTTRFYHTLVKILAAAKL